MTASFNVLDQPWIPAAALDGSETMLGIRQVLSRAHELREICSASPLEEYSLYRFLGLFLMDALRPESEEDIEDLLEEGRFCPERIEEYISACKEEGVSFDLFDEERPFLQSKFDPEMDKESKRPTVLDFTRASGNNHTHFDHDQSALTVLPSDRAARLLLTNYLFCTAAAQGYPSSVYGAPPYFGVIQGSNLFETLVFTLVPLDRIGISFDSPPVLWRRKTAVIPKQEVGKTSWLQGMLFPARRIHLIPDEEGNVTAVHLRQGENYVNKTGWRDPYITYRRGKDGFFPMRPSAERAIWRNLSDIVDVPGGQASQLLTLYRTPQRRDAVSLMLYGVETSQASYLGIYRHNLSFPLSLTRDPATVDCLRLCIRAVESLASVLRKSLSNVDSLSDAAASLAVQQYYQKCEARFWQLCDRAAAEKPGKDAYIAYCEDVSAYANEAFSSVLKTLNLRAAALAAAEKQRAFLLYSIRKLKQEARL